MKYQLRLRDQHRVFFDHKARLFLDYYNPQGVTDILTEGIKKAVKNAILVDLNGEVKASLEAEEKIASTETPIVAQQAEVKEAKEEEVKAEEVVEETTEEETDDIDEEEEVKPEKKTAPKRNNKKTSSTKK